MDTVDVVVAGGGLVGAALAYELAGDGARVALVDRHDPGRASDAGAGILSPETIGTPDPAWFSLAMAAGEHYRRLVPALVEAGAGDPGYDVCGAIRLAFREVEEPMYEESVRLAHARCGDVVHDITVEEARERFPPLGDIRAALFNPRAARVDGRRMTAALVEAAVRRGVVHRRGSVTGVRRAGGTLSAVETDDGAITAGALAVCGGAWTPELARRLGVEQLPVSPVRGQIVHLRLEGVDTSAWPILQPVLSFYMVPWPEGRIAVGATVEPHAGFDARPTAGGLRMLFPEMLRLAPGLADATFLEVRAGLRPVSSDDTPILGELDEAPGVHVATGMGANGLLLGPISGRLVADEILGRAPAIDLAPFRASRFATA